MDPIIVLIIILLVLWLLGLIAFPIGGAIHVLLVLVLVLVVIRLLQGRSLL